MSLTWTWLWPVAYSDYSVIALGKVEFEIILKESWRYLSQRANFKSAWNDLIVLWARSCNLKGMFETKFSNDLHFLLNLLSFSFIPLFLFYWLSYPIFQIVQLLLSYRSIDVNTINDQNETAMDLVEKLQYGESKLTILEALTESGAKHARYVGQEDVAMELKRTVSDIKHEVHSQLIQNEKTNRRVSGIAKELRKLHREAVQNTTNSVTVVAVLFASIAFLAIFNLPGQYETDGPEVGRANISNNVGFRIFCLLNATSLFISLAVVVVQITLVAWDTRSQKQVVSVVNKLMWAACISTGGAFLAIAFVIVGQGSSWMSITITLIGTPILVGTLAFMCYFVFRQRFGFFSNDSQRRIRRASGSKSFSWSVYSANVSDLEDYNSDREKIYALWNCLLGVV